MVPELSDWLHLHTQQGRIIRDMTAMDTTSFGTLSCETQENIAPFLSQYDLAVCTRVCRAWNAIFHPVLWRHVEDRSGTVTDEQSEDQTWADRFMQCARKGALKRNGHLIESLRLVTKKIRMGTFLRDCPPAFPRLTLVRIDGVHNGEEEDLVEFLDMCTAGLKEFMYCVRDEKWETFFFGPAAADALVKHAATLEVFRLEGDHRCNDGAIDHLLCSLPNLKELSIVGNSVEDRGGFLDARWIVSSEWVCNDLEIFGCGIHCIARPELAKETVDESASVKEGKLQESISLQRQVYSQLAQFTKLRKLTLGYDVDMDKPGYGYFSEEQFRQCSGLAMTFMEVGIGNTAEKAWVAENWPKARIGRTIYTSETGDI